MSFKEFKKQLKSQSAEEQDKIFREADSAGGWVKDERFWYPSMNEKKKSKSIIRLMPAGYPEKAPFVKLIRYKFDGPGGTYDELSLETLGQTDPVNEYWKKLWNAGDKEEAAKFKRKMEYISNICVLSEALNTDNEWENSEKIYLYRFGNQIFVKVQQAHKPEDPDDVRFNPFDPFEGADLEIRTVGKTMDDGKKVPNYEQSKFRDPAPLFDGDEEKIEQAYNKCYKLGEFKADNLFKSYDELRALFAKVMGWDEDDDELKPAKKSKKKSSEDDEDEEDDKQKKGKGPKQTTLEEDELPDWGKGKKKKKVEEEEEDEEEDSEDDEEEEEEELEDSEEEDDEDAEDEESEEEEDEEEEEKPKAKTKKVAPKNKKVVKPKKEVEEDSEDEDDEEEEKPAPKKSKKQTTPPKKGKKGKKEDIEEEEEDDEEEEEETPKKSKKKEPVKKGSKSKSKKDGDFDEEDDFFDDVDGEEEEGEESDEDDDDDEEE